MMIEHVLRLIVVTWLALLAPGLVATNATAQTAEVWRLAAQSDFIVVGTIDALAAEFRDGQASRGQSYATVRVADVVGLKGAPPHPLAIRHYLHDSRYTPSSRRLIELSGRRTIMFLVHIGGDVAGVYFAGNSPDAIMQASPGLEDQVRREIDRQARVLRDWRLDPSLPHFATVRRALERVAALERTGGEGAREIQAREFHRIEELGPSAAPAIVALMDDRRPLAFSEISLVNHAPDAFEGIRHYGPELIVDALSAILNQLTGERFRAIYNGGAEQERVADVNGWRIYASRPGQGQ